MRKVTTLLALWAMTGCSMQPTARDAGMPAVHRESIHEGGLVATLVESEGASSFSKVAKAQAKEARAPSVA